MAVKEFKMDVLFVHGIGLQKRGETLLSFGEPLVNWLKKWTSDASGTPGTDVKDTQLEPAPHTPSFARIEISVPKNEDDDRAHQDSQSWILAESWWAEKFKPLTSC